MSTQHSQQSLWGLAIHSIFQGTLVPVRGYLSHPQGPQPLLLPVLPRATTPEHPNLSDVKHQEHILKDVLFLFMCACLCECVWVSVEARRPWISWNW